MKSLSKYFLVGVVLTSMLGMTACQNMGNTDKHASNGVYNKEVRHSQIKSAALTDDQIIKVLSTANNGEIMQAQTAMPKLQTTQARQFAQNMINKHSKNESKGQALVRELGLAPQASHTSNALQTDSNNVVAKLNSINSPVDKAYIMSQIKVHDKVLKTIDKELLPNVKQSKLREFLLETRSAVAMHLQEARQLDKMMY